jgi:hypothetical protein
VSNAELAFTLFAGLLGAAVVLLIIFGLGRRDERLRNAEIDAYRRCMDERVRRYLDSHNWRRAFRGGGCL